MAVKHKKKPFWGLQYHPESVCTDHEGHKVLQNWFSEAGLESRIFPGDWPGREDGVSYQDVVVAGRAA